MVQGIGEADETWLAENRKHDTPLYAAAACRKYNERKNENAFGTFMRRYFA